MYTHDYLFLQSDIFAVIRHNEAQLVAEISKLSTTQPRGEVIQKLVKRFQFTLPTLGELKLGRTYEKEVDLRGQQVFLIGSTTGRRMAVPVTVPFSGDKEWFEIKARTSNMNPPHGIVVTSTSLEFEQVVWKQDTAPEQVRAQIDTRVKEIQQHLSWLQHDVDQWNTGLEAQITRHLDNRQRKLDELDEFNRGLGAKA